MNDLLALLKGMMVFTLEVFRCPITFFHKVGGRSTFQNKALEDSMGQVCGFEWGGVGIETSLPDPASL